MSLQEMWPWYFSGLDYEREDEVITGTDGENVEGYELDTK